MKHSRSTNRSATSMRRGMRRAKRTRAAALLEFVLIFPMFLFLVFFILDMSRVLLVSGAVQDATYRAARASATVGGAQLPDGRRVAETAFEQAIDEIPGGDGARGYRLTVRRGAVCRQADPYVELRVTYRVNLLTPGLGALFEIAGGNSRDVPRGGFSLTSTAVARCEVAQ